MDEGVMLLLGMDPKIAYCSYCIEAYENGIEPGESACDIRSRGEKPHTVSIPKTDDQFREFLRSQKELS